MIISSRYGASLAWWMVILIPSLLFPVLKTGASGMIAYRLLCKDLSFQYVQTSSRLVYKNSKPDFIVSTHRPLTEEEGKDLLSKRTMDFKVSAANRSIGEVLQSRRRPLLGPSPG